MTPVLAARVALICTVIVFTCSAADWPNWRGPHSDGSSDETNLPDTWTAASAAWVYTFPGPGESTPVVHDGMVFVTSAERNGSTLFAIAVDAKTGTEKWKIPVVVTALKAPNNTMCSPSAAADASRAYFMFSTGDIAAIDRSGTVVWSNNIAERFGPLGLKFGYASTPLVYGTSLIIQVIRGDMPHKWWGVETNGLTSFLLAMNTSNGAELWRVTRPDEARDESKDAYTSPVMFDEACIIAGADAVTAHNPADGSELWRFTYARERRRDWRLVPSPVAADSMLFVMTARGNGDLYAVPSGRRGTITHEDCAWTFTGTTPDVCVPLYYRGALYVLGDVKRVLMKIDPKTGEKIWEGRIDAKEIYRASPTGADGKIYVISESGTVTVLSAGDEFKILSRIPMGGKPARAGIAAADGALYIRTADKLYCVRK
ncbi:MAG: PQQ-like beta-propeller repeat protein [Spirochaetes bacterium]|nr:PQQ-like beta-propeller repeat protein [Spirochaetota bacterium]